MSIPCRKAIVNNTEINVAPLETVSLRLLLQKDEGERIKLYSAARSLGFFYLDVSDSKPYLADVGRLYSVTEQYFAQSEENLLKDFRMDDEFRGYKGENNWGSLEILRDDVISSEVPLPDIIESDSATVQRFISASHEVSHVILGELSKSLWPDSEHHLEEKHHPKKRNNSSLKVYRGPTLENLADVRDNTHTDGGSLTLLYTDKWGTQVELPWNKEWAWVEAKPGHAIVTVGDTLQALTGGLLYSCRHRVSQPVGGFEERWAVTYFFRPENDTSLVPL
ncbi:hypothetical protein TWF970_006519 [Orbilia oligospora]|uniref:Fe2OG dioxygenase domain-containing protein n=1 Tax=Orbilia oligospora TaxID=2813651 RepID=A0A7C8R7X6_ORBOL|nr:hypothetical protein TWF970_006519 [Orbilia oligospora]